MADRYPILVDRYEGDQGLRIVCERCHAQATITADDVSSEGFPCPARCGGWADYMYAEADRCGGCGKLGFWDPRSLDGCCSRVCVLQKEYLLTLKARAK